jgi:hypothetical protein
MKDREASTWARARVEAGRGGDGRGAARAGHVCGAQATTAVTFVVAADSRPPGVGADDVLNPSWRMTARMSAFCTGLAIAPANKLLPSTGSVPLYALTAIIGEWVFLLFVLLIYRAAPSPSTVQQRQPMNHVYEYERHSRTGMCKSIRMTSKSEQS